LRMSSTKDEQTIAFIQKAIETFNEISHHFNNIRGSTIAIDAIQAEFIT